VGTQAEGTPARHRLGGVSPRGCGSWFAPAEQRLLGAFPCRTSQGCRP
jgi:hypothetical protein